MALISCPDCGTEVSDRAPACVKCGAPIAAVVPTAPPILQAAPPLPGRERVLIQEGQVSVSTSRFVVGAQTYPMANVSSVKAFSTSANITFPVLILLAAILWGIAAAARSAWGELFFAVPLFGLGVYLTWAAKPTYHVCLATSGGEVRPVSAYDKAYIERIVAALNEAIVNRG